MARLGQCEMCNRFNQKVAETAIIGALSGGGVDIEQHIRLKSRNRRTRFAAGRPQNPGAQRRIVPIECAGEMGAPGGGRAFTSDYTLEHMAKRWGRKLRHLDF